MTLISASPRLIMPDRRRTVPRADSRSLRRAVSSWPLPGLHARASRTTIRCAATWCASSWRVQDGRIQQAWFDGDGCCISQAAASMLMQTVEGKSLDEVQTVHRRRHAAPVRGPAHAQSPEMLPARLARAASALFSPVAETESGERTKMSMDHRMSTATSFEPIRCANGSRADFPILAHRAARRQAAGLSRQRRHHAAAAASDRGDGRRV